MSVAFKRAIGRLLWRFSARSARLRRLVSPWGMRTKAEWFAGRTATAFLPDLVRGDFDAEGSQWLQSLGYAFYELTDTGFAPAERLRLCRRGEYVFLNYLLTRRQAPEVAALFARVQPCLARIDLRKSTHFRPNWEREQAS